ncbi:unnamed protein product [Orchesella dallaii]|uniref:Uncharacterized protein n=1 Tax=Orchesella dallaii TaxID=48710 RepID=A0ABP1R4W6_9HEXA
MNQFPQGAGQRFPPGVYAPPPRFIRNSFVSPPRYIVPHHRPVYQSYSQPQPRPHYPQSPRIPREDEYVPNLPLELWPPHLNRHPFPPPRPPPPYPNPCYPIPFQGARGGPPQLVVGHPGGYFVQPRGGNPQPHHHFSNYWGPAPPPPIVSTVYRPPPPYPQSPYRGNAPGHPRCFSGPIPRNLIKFKNGYPVIPLGNPPRFHQPNPDQDSFIDYEDGEPWYDNEDEVLAASRRMQTNNNLMNSVLDEEVVHCEPNLGTLTRVESLKRQVELLENGVKKETEGRDLAKTKCDAQIKNFRKATEEYNHAMEKFGNQNYEEVSNDGAANVHQEMKTEMEQDLEANIEQRCCEDEGEQNDSQPTWREGIFPNYVEGWRPLTADDGPGYEALELLRNRNFNSQSQNTEHTVSQDPACFATPPFPIPPPHYYHYPQHQDDSLTMLVSPHGPQHYQPPPPPLQQYPFPQQQMPPQHQQQQAPQLAAQYGFEPCGGHQPRFQITENEARIARLRMYLRLIFEEKNRREREAMVGSVAQNPEISDAAASTTTTAAGEHSNPPAASGMGPTPNLLPPVTVQQGRLSNRLMSGGGIVEVTQSAPKSSQPISTAPTGSDDSDAAKGEKEEENAPGNDDENGINGHGEMEVEQQRSPSQLKSQTLRLNAPTLAKLLGKLRFL